MPFSQSLAIVPQDAVACGRLYFIVLPRRFVSLEILAGTYSTRGHARTGNFNAAGLLLGNGAHFVGWAERSESPPGRRCNTRELVFWGGSHDCGHRRDRQYGTGAGQGAAGARAKS